MLVIGGMVLVGVFTATLTSILVRDEEAWQQDGMEEQFRRMDRLEESISKIDQRLDEALGDKPPPEPPGSCPPGPRQPARSGPLRATPRVPGGKAFLGPEAD
ncbi:MAG: hypothetical protein MK312_10290 [Roseibacillus sp.]|nr:hypothetical protein [Roseibacillus sp.]